MENIYMCAYNIYKEIPLQRIEKYIKQSIDVSSSVGC